MTSLQSSHGLLSWHCHDCNMTFTNPALLQKHKARFCIGKPGIVLLQTPEFDDKPLPEPPEEPTPRSKFDPDARIRELSESHRRLMEYLQNKNLDLEKQREEIRRQLEALGRRPVAKDNSSEDLIRELREREEANQRLLVELRRQLMEARRPVNIIQSSSEPAPQPQLEKKSFIYPMYYGPSLVAEIIAVRQAYMQNGGTDPDILSQLADMLAEAQAIEEALKNAQKRQPKDKKDGSSSQLMILEVENERLQRQLVLLQDQKASIAARRKGNRDRDRESDLERELHRMHREHLRKMYELQREIERLRQESMLDRMRLELQVQQPPSIILQQPSGTTHLLPVSEAVPAGPPQAAAAAPPPPPPPTTQRHPPAPTASALPPATQRDGSTTILLPYDEYSSPRRIQAYGHTWVHTHHRQETEEDPNYDLQL